MYPKLTRIVNQHPLLLVLLLSFILRFAFLLVSNHLYYPDEIFQTLEPAFAHISGFGIEPWEYQAGIRPLMVPLLLSLPLKVFYTISRGNPHIYTLLMKIFLSTWSIVIPLAIYQVVKKSYTLNPSATRYALLAGLLGSTWYELIYVSPRALYETLAMNVLATTYLLHSIARHYKQNTIKKEFAFLVCGGLLALAGAIRPQLLILLPLLIHWFSHQTKWEKNRLVFGCLLSLLAMGGYEYAQTGYFMHSFLRYLDVQLTTPISNVFGVQSVYYYAVALLATSGVLVVIALATLKAQSSQKWWLAFGLIIGSHSLVEHKELRFILPIIPILLILFGLSLELWQQKYTRLHAKIPEILVGACIVVSMLSLFNVFPWVNKFYPVPLLSSDPLLQVANALHFDATACGVYDETNTWPQSLSYYLTNRKVPLYSQDYPPPNEDVISHKLVQTSDGIQVMVKQPTTCATDTTYSPKRTFPEIQSILEHYRFSSVK